MKRLSTWVLAMAMLLFAGNLWAASLVFNKPGGGFILQKNKHIIFLGLVNTKSQKGRLAPKGVNTLSPVFINETEKVRFAGVSSSSETTEITLLPFRPGVNEANFAMAVLDGTAEKDEGKWFVKLKDGREIELNPRQFHIRGDNVVIKESVTVSYGGFDGTPPPVSQESSMDFKGGKLKISFNVNPRTGGIVKGFMESVNLFDVSDIRWSSDKKGWGDGSVAIGKFPLDTEGNIVMPVITIDGLDPDDNGNVVIKKKDGTLVWCNIGFEGWKFSSNVKLDQQQGRIIFTGNK